MALKPVLKLKVDELFLRWLSNPDTQQLLITNLRQIQTGEPLTYHPQSLSNGGAVRGGAGRAGQSPRMRPGSPSTPPCSPSMASPRSPRRSLGAKLKSKLSLQKDRNGDSAGARDSLPKRGDPDGQSDPFLRQKEAELREKREREGKTTGSKKESRNANSNTSDNSQAGNTAWNSNGNNAASKNTSLTVLPDNSNISPSASKSSTSNNSNNLSNAATNSGNYANNHMVANDNDVSNNMNAKGSKSQPHLHRLRTTGPGAKNSSVHGSKSDSGVADEQQRMLRLQQMYKNVHVPQFYFPKGLPGDGGNSGEDVLSRIREEFGKVEGGRATKDHMKPITKACGLPMYMSTVVYRVFGGEKHGHLTLQQFLASWRKLCAGHHDDAAKFVHLIAKPGCQHLVHDDFVPLIQDVVEAHPGLTFLQEAPEFHSRYVQTVISRVFYCVNRSWTGRITANELRRSNLIQTLKLLDEEEDINQITDFFSYEHFYVIYCKFWELDKDHDLYISKDDLARHNDHAISSKMIDRIFSGAVTKNLKEEKMSYKDFVWFLISEEDKRHPTSIEYWFRCMDLDGDGVISMYEMEYFYREQVEKMEQLGIETLPFEDTLCQMLDMIKPSVRFNVCLRDLKACKLTPIFFDTFFNLDKYLEHEQKDPFANQRDMEDGEPEMSDWERYAAEEYELLVAEEGANDNMDELVYEDDFEAEEEEIASSVQQQQQQQSGPDAGLTQQQKTSKQSRPKAPSPDDDIYEMNYNSKDLKGY